MKWVAVIVSACLLSGCSAIVGSTYMTERVQDDTTSRFPHLKVPMRLYGDLPAWAVLSQLKALEVVHQHPPISEVSSNPIAVPAGMLASDAINAIENDAGWIYDPATFAFYHASATHSVDAPDSFGRPTVQALAPKGSRPIIAISFLFRRVSGSATMDDLGGGGTFTTLTGSIPDGVQSTWSSATERTYYEGVRDTEGGQVVETTLRKVQAGLILNALAARLPGGKFRLDGALEISSFIGQGIEKAQVAVPMQLDGPRGQWIRTLVIRGGDASARVALRHFDFDLSASADSVELLVKVD